MYMSRLSRTKSMPNAIPPNAMFVSAFNAAVYALVKTIPRGRVATYGQLAKLLCKPRHSRHVGTALANMPETMKIPWHRVLNSQGRISIRRTNWQSGSDDWQRILLEAEGVVFDETGKIRLREFQWEP